MALRAGEIVADRFEVQALAGSGGMGHVYRASDRVTGARVALKIMHPHLAGQEARFTREAEVLARLSHPSIVSYVASGVDAGERRYLAMEWVDGARLDQVIGDRPVSARAAARLCRALAEAVGELHARGVVHRDLKPGNVLLADGDLERPKVLDLGIARVEGALSLTEAGAMLGTPGWIAPEQARGERNTGARADVFALGCLLFRCLTGRAPFVADDLLGVLLKVSLEPAPRVSELRADVPEALDELVERMLAKSPDDRPADGARRGGGARAVPRVGADPVQPPPARARRERAADGVPRPRPTRPRAGVDARADRPRGGGRRAVRRAARRARGRVPVALHRRRAGRHGARHPVGARGPRAPRRGVRRGAGLRPALADLARAARRGDRSRRPPAPPGRARDLRAHRRRRRGPPRSPLPGRRRRRRALAPGGARPPRGGAHAPRPRDAVRGPLARAPAPRCDVRRVRRGARGARGPARGPARHRQVARALRAARRARQARAAARGALRPERPARRGRAAPPRRAARAAGGGGVRGRGAGRLRAPPPRARRPLRPARRRAPGRGVPGGARRDPRAPAGARPADPKGPPGQGGGIGTELEEARRDPLLMGDQMLRAWLAWLEAEARSRPLVVVLEDLHWADLPTIRFVGEALGRLEDSALFVVALARPEVHEKFPRLWAGRRVQEVRVEELTRRASEALVRDALGDAADAATVARVVERASGNALFLEELVRAVAEGRATELPGSVLAMMEERLGELDAQARRVLRAASVFGQSFHRAGLAELLGGERRAGFVPEVLEQLVRAEVVSRRGDRGVVGDEEYLFQHALLREAAYAMLTDEDRALGHRLAGAWLEGRGGVDPAVIAEHFERGGEARRAASYFALAAQTALEGGDFAAAIAHASRGAREAEAEGPIAVGQFLLLSAEAHAWSGSFLDAERTALAALELVPAGSAAWHTAAALAVEASGRLGHRTTHLSLGEELLRADVSDDVRRAFTIAAARAALQAVFASELVLADALLARLDAIGLAGVGAEARGLVLRARAARASGSPAEQIRLSHDAVDAYREAGDLRNMGVALSNLGDTIKELGDLATARDVLVRALEVARAAGEPWATAAIRQNLGFCLSRLGERDAARAELSAAIGFFAASGSGRMESATRGYLALDLLAAGELPRAEREARAALEVSTSSPATHAWSCAVLADVLLAKGSTREALGFASQAKDALEEIGALDEGEAEVRLVWAAALAAAGRRDEARQAAVSARRWVGARARRIDDPRWQRSFLEGVQEHARIDRLAEELGVVPAV